MEGRVLSWETIHGFARRYGIALSVRGRLRTAQELLELIYAYEQRHPPRAGLYVNGRY